MKWRLRFQAYKRPKIDQKCHKKERVVRLGKEGRRERSGEERGGRRDLRFTLGITR
jgi:hypothetical protein